MPSNSTHLICEQQEISIGAVLTSYDVVALRVYEEYYSLVKDVDIVISVY